MKSICPKCNHSLFDHSDDMGCEMNGCKCREGFEDTASRILSEYDAEILALKRIVKVLLRIIEAHTSEHTQYAQRVSIFSAIDTLKDDVLGIWLHCMTCNNWHYEKESCITANRIDKSAMEVK